jgi:hypothetical protein
MPSAGTPTMRFTGRAKPITYDVLDPRAVEELPYRGAVAEWREDYIEEAVNRRRWHTR